jgi:thiaminase/transcriptional activator TenA
VSFAQTIEGEALPLRQAILSHPFITGVGDGTLPVEKFKHYVTQDYVYLIDYARVIALASARAPDLQSMAWFAALLDQILNTEMDLHRSYCAEFGITKQELEATQPSPTTVAYTSYLLRIAYHGSFAELVACLLPCLWGYWEVGNHLTEQGEPKSAPLYCQWIQMYASTEYADLARNFRSLADGLAEGVGAEQLGVMSDAYLTSMRLELKFWDMAYKLERWQV